MRKWGLPVKVLQPIARYLEEQRKKLENRKRDLEKEDPFSDTTRLIDNAASDTEAAEEIGHERISALRLEIDKTLIRIKKTLTRIKLNKYGLCARCHKMIDTDRLAANPTAEYCIECEKKIKNIKE